MKPAGSTRADLAPMALFVLLWGTAPIVTRWGLDHGSPFALLILRFGTAFAALLILGLYRRRWLPIPGTRWRVAATGFLLVACYSITYLEAMALGITPGLLAIVLGIQPILTLFLMERRFSALRLGGLLVALGGLAAVVYESLAVSRFAPLGMVLALGALACITAGSILQKSIQQAPAEILPLQYAVTLGVCLAVAPFQPAAFEVSTGFLAPALWLGLIVSVVAQILLYRMIRSGNLVNVTSLFYLVPVVAALMDYLVLGNLLSLPAMAGMAAILLGVALVFHQDRPAGG
jgi:drug/metabolite transporter (DMT)-like permease